MNAGVPASPLNRDSGDPLTGRSTANEILRAIRRIVQRITIHSKQLYRETGLTVPQLLCLRAIAEADEEITAAVVSRLVHLSPATVTGILDRLERDGFIRRERHARDRRKVLLFLTAKGRDHIDNPTSPLQEKFLMRLADLDEAEREQMLATLERVVEMIGARSIDAAPILVSGDITKPTIEG